MTRDSSLKSQASSSNQDAVDEPRNASTEDIRVFEEVGRRFDQAQLDGQFNLTVELACRADGNPKKPAQFSRRTSPSTFRDIRADRNGSRAHLRGQPIPLSSWKSSCGLINGPRKGDAFMPHIETSKVAHTPVTSGFGWAIQPLSTNGRPSENLYTCRVGSVRVASSGDRVGGQNPDPGHATWGLDSA